MDLWFQRHPKLEREYQQLVVRENNGGKVARDTDYFIVDVEYVNTSAKCRLDMLAVKWLSTASQRRSGNNVRLAFIEKKYGDAALKGKSGLVDHVKAVYTFLTATAQGKEIFGEAESMFNQKFELDLISGVNKTITLKNSRPELLLLIASHKPGSPILRGEIERLLLLPEYQYIKEALDVKLIQSSLMGFGLYSERMIALEDALKIIL